MDESALNVTVKRCVDLGLACAVDCNAGDVSIENASSKANPNVRDRRVFCSITFRLSPIASYPTQPEFRD